ncbi:hypothetical protein L1994_10025 [Methanomicrobium antiquum]|uniref:Uncharacterized protein n=1 Tax=Methanomicrobium antiquum TaxID=487686 RepID=A0AAF0FWU0_9EURY|nr:hypothetical protein [Methanomicrobium antiquum]WFN36469.1 hypothetical protein L1994_10025 [Methanomicrobium antiquum]
MLPVLRVFNVSFTCKSFESENVAVTSSSVTEVLASYSAVITDRLIKSRPTRRSPDFIERSTN